MSHTSLLITVIINFLIDIAVATKLKPFHFAWVGGCCKMSSSTAEESEVNRNGIDYILDVFRRYVDGFFTGWKHIKSSSSANRFYLGEV